MYVLSDKPFTAYIGIDWADSKHDACLQAAGSEQGLLSLAFHPDYGQNGEIFTVYKFRSMREDAEEQTGPVWAAGDDDRVTRVGRFLRKTRLDEVPQLFNVVRGHMSFVGPRPERPFFVEQLSKEIPYYVKRHAVKPGITGWAQVRYSYGASVEDAKEKLEYDLYYVKNLSLLLDLEVIIDTFKVVVLGKGAR